MRNLIIFLDFDGVIATSRVSECLDGGLIDPIACSLIRRVCNENRAQIVVSSTWRRIENECWRVLAKHGLREFLHGDWRTPITDGRRGDEIQQWLDANNNPPFVILDDEDFDINEDQLEFLIKTDEDDGLTYAAFRQFSALAFRLRREAR